jgi:YggT family protein
MNVSLALLNFVEIFLQIMSLLVLVRVLISWFPIDPANPIIRILFQLTEPILAPFRRVIPRIGMFDLSPLACLLVIQFLQQALPSMFFR